MKITEHKAKIMFQALIQDCFQNVDDKCPDNVSPSFWNPLNSIDYKAMFYGELFEHDLISYPTFAILSKGILNR